MWFLGYVQWFRGGLILEAHKLLYHSAEGTKPQRRCTMRATSSNRLVPEPFQIRTSCVVHLGFSWYKFKTEDFYNCFTGPCFKVCITKI